MNQRLHTRPNRLIFIGLFVIIFAVIFLSATSGLSASKQTVYVVSISGEVDPGMASFMERAYEDTLEKPNGLVVIEINTFGGRVDSALEIVETLLKFPKERSIAFIEKKAISAGSLIALACGKLVMKPATTIGDCAPISITQEGPQMLGEKFQSPLRAKFRALAKRNGYPEVLTEAMVTPEKVVYSVEIDGKKSYMDAHDYADLTLKEKEKITSKKTIVAEGELLTMDSTEALELGFSEMTATSIDDMLGQMGVKNYEQIRIVQTWSESMVRFIGSISPILMMIGLAALYMEMKAPGFGLPGLIGIFCLGVVFLNQYLVGLADYMELLIILFGLVLMGIEVFVLPGFGIAGFAGIVCIAVGMILSLQGFVFPDPSIPWEMDLLMHNIAVVISAYIVAFFIALLFLRYVLPRFSTKQRGPYLKTSLKAAHADSSETAKIRIGDKGIALSYLRPSGKADFNDDLFDVVSESEFVEKGTDIKVSAIKGNRIIVSRIEEK